MTVVGHFEQLRQSDCYKKSADLTCITCHDPHAKEKPKDTLAFFRQKCLDCHAIQPCGLNPAERRKKDATDNCAACHMPRGDTEIPHIAFTHHRIGRHSKPLSATENRVPDLMPIEDNALLNPLDRERNLGLAYLEASRKPQYARYAESYRKRALQHLEAVDAAKLSDAETALGIAEIFLKDNPSRSIMFAQMALEFDNVSASVRAQALMVLGYCEAQTGKNSSAIATLEELVRLRRASDDWRILGMSYLKQSQPDKAIAAFQQALAIRPFRYSTHAGIAEAFRQLGDLPRTKEHLEKAQWLRRNRPD